MRQVLTSLLFAAALAVSAAERDRAPEIGAIKTSGTVLESPDGAVVAWTEASDPEGGAVSWRWELYADTPDFEKNLSSATAKAGIAGSIVSGQGTPSVVAKLPSAGAYRLCAFVSDAAGNASHASVSVRLPSGADDAALPAAEMPRAVYRDGSAASWFASGYMGNRDALSLDEMCHETPHDGATCLKVEYSAKDGWAGVYWQDPANDWGDLPGGANLSKATALEFYARGERGGEKATFFMGGITDKRFSDTCRAELKDAVLSREWTRCRIPLAGLDLKRVKSGFGFVLAADGAPVTFYLDDIQYIAER